jgi:hypothetical protein
MIRMASPRVGDLVATAGASSEWPPGNQLRAARERMLEQVAGRATR